MHLKTIFFLGDEVSKYASEHLHWYITRRPEYEENDIAEAMRRVNTNF